MNNVPSPDVSVFIKLMDRGFNLSVPADQEKFYREGYEAFMHKVKHHKRGKNYDDIEAIALASIDCLVALQKSQEVMKELIEAFQNRVAKLDDTISAAIES
ncbi:cell division protein ZapA [Dyadobacter sandarakinus]|uniref:Cell division protein ZapA n=1 Tax=Dyadobacter sandarakinus TaxID=2747268 RepID=A0ABX7I0Y0_9BACT|nr:cell division protein ZapA [Dyadobacter sandarakinus]QRQ99413.1 cell division protein ZapA [Dyadobacter sandarakinus]